MKKILLVLSLLIFFLFQNVKFVEASCGIEFSPTSPVEGNSLTIQLKSLYLGHTYKVDVFRDGTFAMGWNLSSDHLPNTSYPIVVVRGSYEVKVYSPGITSVTNPECSKTVPVTAPAPPPGGPGGDALKNPPKGWLKSIVPDFGPAPAVGIDYFESKLIPFLTGAALFLLIVLSLIFLIIGGIKYMTSGGNKEGVVKAKGTITYALIGLAVGLGAFVIVQMLFSMFNTP